MHTIIETGAFARKSAKLLSEAEYAKLTLTLAANPIAGDLIQGTGGFRKIRIAREGSGKSGGFRAVYFFHCQNCPVYLVDVFAKNEKSNLSKEERNMLAKVAAIIKQAHP